MQKFLKKLEMIGGGLLMLLMAWMVESSLVINIWSTIDWTLFQENNVRYILSVICVIGFAQLFTVFLAVIGLVSIFTKPKPED